MQTIQQAAELHQQGDLDQAEKLYLEALDTEPNHADALHLLGLLRHDQGSLDQAIELVDKAIEQKPEEGIYRNTLGCVYQKSSEWHKAQGCFKKAIELNPNLATAYNNLGYCHLRKGELEQAREMFELALRVEEDFLDALVNIGNTLLELDKTGEAFVHLNKALKLDAESPAVLTSYGWALCKQDKAGLALECFQKALTKDPNLLFTRSLLGKAQLDLGHIEEAQQTFTQGIKNNPDRSESYADMAELFFTKNQLNKALEYLLVAIKKPGATKKTFEKAAATAYQLAQYEIANRFLEALIKQFPNNANYHLKLGQVQAAARNHEQALAALEKAISLDEQLMLPAAIVMAEIYQLQQNHEQAVAKASEVLSQDENNTSAMLILARGALHNHQCDDAINCCDKIIAIADNHVEALRLKAKALDELEQFDNAAKFFIKANKLAKDDESALEKHIASLDTRIQQLPSHKQTDPIDFSTQDSQPKPTFVIGFPGSGFNLVAKTLAAHSKTNVLFDRLSAAMYRHDCFLRYQINELDQLDEATILLERRRYWQHVDRVLANKKNPAIFDLMPFQLAAPEIIYRFFPEAAIIWVQRDLTDIKLHNLASGLGQGATIIESTNLIKKFNKLQTTAEQILNLDYLPTTLKTDADAKVNVSALLTCFDLEYETTMQAAFEQAKLDRFGINKYFPDGHSKHYLSYLSE